MHRDKLLICAILKKIEASTTGHFQAAFEIEGYDPDLVRYHLRLCVQAGFIEWPEYGSQLPTAGWHLTLTWQGHNVLEKLKAGCKMNDITE